MKLSVLIPVYNRAVGSLLNELADQAVRCTGKIEIICLDDGSDFYAAENKETAERLKVQYHLRENKGRAVSRNELMRLASGDYLLFLDCDSGIIRPDFLETYLRLIDRTQTKVLYGGRVYPENPPGNGFKLHWKYGRKIEAASLKKRLKEPHLTFMSNNFVVQKNILNTFPMDEELRHYGYEDLLWALVIKENKINIDHCDNPVRHEDLCSTEVFLAKSKQALVNLSKLVVEQKIDHRSTPLLKTYDKLLSLKLLKLFYFFFGLSKKIISIQLKSKYPVLGLFSIWKLGHYAEIMDKMSDKA